MHFTSFFLGALLATTAVHHAGYIQKISPRTYAVSPSQPLPKEWDWGDVNGTNYLTKSLNQHIPQYCGSCWAHGAVSALGDRLKIARNASQPDLNLAVQFLLNCGDAGSCEGGDHLAAYRFIKDYGGIPFDTCLAYEACSTHSPPKHVKTAILVVSPSTSAAPVFRIRMMDAKPYKPTLTSPLKVMAQSKVMRK